MKIIGITGGIGSGKSIICKVFELFGVPIYSADLRANWLVNNDLQLKKEIKELFGKQAYNEDGQYDRKWVANQVFENPQLLQMLSSLIHPRVFEDTKKWLNFHKNQPYVLREAAISNVAKQNNLDRIIVVTCPISLRIQRIKARDPYRSKTEIRAIIARQSSEQKLGKVPDYQIINDNKTMILPQIIAIHKAILEVF